MKTIAVRCPTKQLPCTVIKNLWKTTLMHTFFCKVVNMKLSKLLQNESMKVFLFQDLRELFKTNCINVSKGIFRIQSNIYDGLFAINYYRCSQGFKHTSAIDAIVTLAAPPSLFVVLNLKIFETWSLGSNVNQSESLQSRGGFILRYYQFGKAFEWSIRQCNLHLRQLFYWSNSRTIFLFWHSCHGWGYYHPYF